MTDIKLLEKSVRWYALLKFKNLTKNRDRVVSVHKGHTYNLLAQTNENIKKSRKCKDVDFGNFQLNSTYRAYAMTCQSYV